MASPCVPYVITEIFCIAFAASILFRLDSSIGSEHEVLELRNLICAYLVMLVTDILWTLFNNDVLLPSRWVNLTVDAVLVASISFGCYFWFMFIQDRLHQTRPVRKRRTLLLTAPIVFISVLDFISIFTGFLFYVDAYHHYQSTAFFLLQSVVNYFYLVIPTVACACHAVRSQSKAERSEYFTYSAYMLAPLISGLLEEALPLVPVPALSMFMVIQILFLMIQNRQIYHDALTNLNNRRRLNQFLEERLPTASAVRPMILFMMDLNQFKSINDTFGHMEGDNALRKFSEILKTIAVRRNALIARYGGDEFCLVTDGGSQEPEKIAGEIQDLLRQAQNETTPPMQYSLTVSIGYAVCDQPQQNPDAVLKQADQMLYARKLEWHRNNG